MLTLVKSPANRALLQLKNCHRIKKDDIKKELMISRSVWSAAAQSQQVFEKNYTRGREFLYHTAELNSPSQQSQNSQASLCTIKSSSLCILSMS